jgi:thiol:disulfide interchange protein DsbA
MRRTISLLPMLLGWDALTQAAAPVEGRDYTVLSPRQPTTDPAHLMVTEFFSYQCPHCAAFSRPFAAWSRTVPADVRVERVAVTIGHPAWEPAARAYWALLDMKALEKADDAFFQAIHAQGIRLDTEQQITAWLGARGIDTKAFSAMYHSFGLDAQFRTAEGRARDHRVPSIPLLVIDGRYMVSIDDNGRFPDQLAKLNELIVKARQQRSAGVPGKTVQ